MRLSKSLFLLLLLIFSITSIVLSGCGGGSSSSDNVMSSGLTSKSITISWMAPATNVDGSPITDLAGYKIYYGQGSGNYINSIDIGNTTTATIKDLSAGTWCLVATSYDFSGNESGYSNEVCTNIPI